MSTLTIQGTVSFPLGGEADPPDRPFKAQLIYTKRAIQDVVLAGVQTNVNVMGTLTNAKAAYVEVTSGTGDFTVNGGDEPVPIGGVAGFWLWFNPAGGLTALTVTTAASASFRVYLFS